MVGTSLQHFSDGARSRTIRSDQLSTSTNLLPRTYPDPSVERAHTHDLIFTSIPSLQSNNYILPPLSSLDHCYHIIRQLHHPHPSSKHTLCRSDGFRDFSVPYSWKHCCFTLSLSISVSNITDIALQDMIFM